MTGPLILGGASPGRLSEAVAELLGTRLHSVERKRYPNDCLEVLAAEECRGADVYVVQSLVPPVQEHLVELLLTLDAARGALAARTTAVIPYLPYARSDKRDRPGVSLGGRMIADLVQAAGADRVVVIGLHSARAEGFFRIPCVHLEPLELLAAHFKASDLEATIVMAPDGGSSRRARELAGLLSVPTSYATKVRSPSGQIHVTSIAGDVADRDVIVFDDEVLTGATLSALFERLHHDGARSIRVACIHGAFSGAVLERLRAHQRVVEVVCTDTLPRFNTPEVTVLSVAESLAATIRRMHEGEPWRVRLGAPATRATSGVE